MSDATAEDSNMSGGAVVIPSATIPNSNNQQPIYEEMKDSSVNSILQVQHSDSTSSLVAEYEKVIHKMDDQLKV